MGSGRGRGKKQIVVASHDDSGSGKEEKILVLKRRGRPQKPLNLKDETKEEEEEEDKEQNENMEEALEQIPNLKNQNQVAVENGSKRKRSDQATTGENGNGLKSCTATDDSSKSIGFRPNGSRRKNKPRRAAEAVVECW